MDYRPHHRGEYVMLTNSDLTGEDRRSVAVRLSEIESIEESNTPDACWVRTCSGELYFSCGKLSDHVAAIFLGRENV